MVKLSFVIPRSELTHEEIEDIKKQAVNLLVQSIQSDGADPRDFVIRDILPTDDLKVGANNEWYFDITQSGKVTLINTTIANDTYVSFYGVAYPDDTKVITSLIFKKGAAVTLAIYQLEKLFAEMEPVGYFKQPIGYKSSDNLVVEAYATNSDSHEKLILRGYLAEPVNRNISA